MTIERTELGGSNNFFLRIDTDTENKLMISIVVKEKINCQIDFTNKNETTVTIDKDDWPKLQKCLGESFIPIIEASCNTNQP